MSPVTRYDLVKLLTRPARGYSYESLASKTDKEMQDLAGERLNNVSEDITDLKAAGLWPMPNWLVKRSVAAHGTIGIQGILACNERAKRQYA